MARKKDISKSVNFGEIGPKNYVRLTEYIETYKPFDKAGSYGIQDWFAVNVEKIDGCFYNVMGFPLARFWKEINELI